MQTAELIVKHMVTMQTHFHTGEITAVSPSKPAAGGALVDVHVLQVHIHTHNASAREKDGGAVMACLVEKIET